MKISLDMSHFLKS